MYIVKPLTVANGGQPRVHRVSEIKVTEAGVTALINSYFDEAAAVIGWQDTYSVPFAAVAAIEGETLAGFYEWLVANDGPFLSGTFVADN